MCLASNKTKNFFRQTQIASLPHFEFKSGVTVNDLMKTAIIKNIFHIQLFCNKNRSLLAGKICNNKAKKMYHKVHRVHTFQSTAGFSFFKICKTSNKYICIRSAVLATNFLQKFDAN